MNLFEYAQKTEESGIRYHCELAAQAPQVGVKGIFNMLATDEEKLLAKIRLIRERFPQIEKLHSRRLRKNGIIFDKLLRNSLRLHVATDLDAYRLAKQAENEVVSHYHRAAEAELDSQTKEVLHWLESLERRELQDIETLYDFANAPNNSLEWAEHSNLDTFHNFGRYEDLHQGGLKL